MITTAEGAANQVEGILERMKELATQSASDNAATDRGKIQAEFDSLLAEVDRIVNDTEYQGTALIKGTFGNEISSTSGFAAGEGAGADVPAAGEASVSERVNVGGAEAGTYTISSANANAITLTFSNAAGDTLASQDVELAASGGTIGAQTVNFDKLGVSINLDSQFADNDLDAATFTVAEGACGGVFQVGSSNSQAADSIGVNLGDMQASELGIDAIDLTTRSGASSALSTIDSAIDSVNETLGDMGAAINRLDYTFSNLQVSIENFSASESVIRDVDMAAEMVNFTKNQILSQAGTAMLAQANMSSQGVLSLIG
jgi:flagellin